MLHIHSKLARSAHPLILIFNYKTAQLSQDIINLYKIFI